MADVLLTLDGIGHGHLIRAVQVSRWLRRAHRRPIIFLQGSYPKELAIRVPGVGIPPLYEVPPATAQLVADEVARYAALNGPAVVIEDTHPAPVTWPTTVCRFLIVRPTTFESISNLNAKHSAECAGMILCDHPDSPTWPYGVADTQTIRGWTRWSAIGPMFRRPSRLGAEDVRARYRVREDEQVFVFSMGGGGEQLGSNDRVRFLNRAAVIAAELRDRLRRSRLLFVCGPLWPPELAVPQPFEAIRYEPDLPSLFRLARGAVIRPGFNSLWECVAAATPFLPVYGTTFAEPVRERLDRMQRHGVEVPDSLAQWLDEGWRTSYRDACRRAISRFPGDPAREFIDIFRAGIGQRGLYPQVYAPQQGSATAETDSYEELRAQLAMMKGPKHVLVRLDDVVVPNGVLDWLISVCGERRLCVSLEVIPYLMRLDRRALDAADPDHICEVSQHGFAHIPHWNGSASMRGEFTGPDRNPPHSAQVLIRRGLRLMTRAFGDRFKGGYSAPYDGLPVWMPSLWAAVGGRYVSWIATRPAASALPQVQLSVDPWDWRTNIPKLPKFIVARVINALRERGSVGLVLHPQCLQQASHRKSIHLLFDTLVQGGCSGEFPSRAAS